MHILIDIGGMLVHSVLKSNQIAQHVVSDVGNKSKQNGTAGRQKKLRKICLQFTPWIMYQNYSELLVCRYIYFSK